MDPAALTNSQLDLLFVLPTAVAYALCMVRLLPMRSRAAYLAVYLAYSVAMNALRSTGTLEMRLPVGLAFDAALPVLLSRGPLHRRVLVVFLSVSCLFVDELLGGALWTAMTDGAPLSDYDAVRALFPQYVLMHALHLAVLVALLEGLRGLLARAGAGAHEGGAWRFAALPAVQAALLGIAVYVCVGQSRAVDGWYYHACAVLALLCLGADAALLWALRSHAEAQRARRHAEQLASRLEAGYAEGARASEAAEDVARFRHDMRNQLAVVGELARQGRRDEALEHVRELLARLQGGGR